MIQHYRSWLNLLDCHKAKLYFFFQKMEALVLFDIDGTTAVVSANLLIDADGCSAVEATKDLDTQYLKSSTWYVMNGGKRLLVEVLDISSKLILR